MMKIASSIVYDQYELFNSDPVSYFPFEATGRMQPSTDSILKCKRSVLFTLTQLKG